MNPRDVQALDLAVSAGLVTTTAAPLVAGVTAERALFDALAFHLGRCKARLEDASGAGRHQEIGFSLVVPRWREAWREPDYPMAILESESRRELSSMGRAPAPDPRDPSADWISPDGLYALWDAGEEQGEGRVLLYASYEPQAAALAAAVEAALGGGPEGQGASHVPLPESFLPTPFQGVLPPALYPKARVVPMPATPTDNELEDAAEEGAWRADVRFSWRAPKLVARPRAADYDPRVSVTVPRP
ncbi:MAG TPA: hypothetical protein VFS43_38380 [Polyangiaceae bacterium]|nr:hypothetical protein [Polyangiaceae bacterium]